MYHRFNENKYPSTNITLEQFESHLQEFSLSKYKVLSLEFILDTIINDGQLPNNTVGISVDDADKTFLTTAWPKFKEKNMPVTLFVNTSTIVDNNKNYLSWDQIRQLKSEGVAIGAHSHTHNHLTELSDTQIIDEIELSNKIFLKELGVIPSLFAYPYGETNEKMMSLLKDYKFKVAFGQHSGVINETSNLYYLPRFSLNEKYGDIDRFKFAANSYALQMKNNFPKDRTIKNINPPLLGFTLLNNIESSIKCYSSHNINAKLTKIGEKRIEIRFDREFPKGRTRINCTTNDKGKWRWTGFQFFNP